jgi:hypothetical protein
MSNRDRLRRDDDALDYRRVMQFDRDMKIVVKWLIDHNLLSQYALTSKLLYSDWLFSFVDLYISFFFFLLFSSLAGLADAARDSRTWFDESTYRMIFHSQGFFM